MKAGINRTELITGCSLFFFAVWYGVGAWMLPKVKMQDVIDSYVYPLALAVVLGFLSLGLILKALRGGDAEAGGSGLPTGKMLRNIAFIFAMLILYIFFFQVLGYLTSTIFFMIVVLKYLDRGRSLWSILLLSVLIAGVCYALFVFLFRIQIPAGILI